MNEHIFIDFVSLCSIAFGESTVHLYDGKHNMSALGFTLQFTLHQQGKAFCTKMQKIVVNPAIIQHNYHLKQLYVSHS